MTSNCNAPPPPDDTQLSSSLAGVMKAMGVTTCMEASGSIYAPFGFGASAGASVGCDQLSVIQNTMTAAQNAISCIITNVSASSTTTITQKNDLHIKTSGINVKEIDVNQINISSVKSITSLTEQQTTEITSVLTSSLKDTIKQLQDSKTEAGSVPDGQKAIAQSLGNIAQDAVNSIASGAALSVVGNVYQDNELTIELNGSDYLSVALLEAKSSGATIVLSQENMSKYVASAIVNTFYDNVFKQTDTATLVSTLSSEQTAVSTVPQSNLFSGIIAVIAIIIGVVVISGGSKVNKVTRFIVPGIFVISVVLAIVFGKAKNVLATTICSIIGLLSGVLIYFSIKKSLAKPKDNPDEKGIEMSDLSKKKKR